MALADLFELSNTLAWTLLHSLWQGLLVGALYGLGKRLSASVAWQHALALGGLLAMLALPAATFWWLLQHPAAVASPVELAAGAAALAGQAPALVAGAADAAGGGTAWAFALVAAWLLGAAVISARLIGDWRLIRSAIREGTRPPAALQALLEEQMQRIGVTRSVRLRLTARITSAGVYGLLRPVVLLPTALALSLPRDQLEALLVHELAHIRRADFLANLLALLARTLLYFHPVVHWLCRDLERTRETLCDDLVVGLKVDRLKYARALSTAEQFRQQVPVPLLTATGGELSARVHRILALAPDRRRDQDRAPLLLALAAIVLSMLGLKGVAPEAPFAVARPDFRAAYQSLVLAPAPRLATPALPLAERARPDPIRPLPAVAGVAAATIDAPAANAAAPNPVSPPMPPVVAPAPELAATAPEPLVSAGLASLGSELAPALPALAAVDAAEATATAGTSQAAPPRVVRKSKPYYPRSARWQGIEGYVTLSYRLDASGAPVAVAVTAAEPAGQFEDAALSAFERWRFDPQSAGTETWTQTFEFNLGEDAGRCEAKLGSRICRRPVAAASIVSGGGESEPGQHSFDRDRLQHGFTRKGVTLRME
jgi:bla regulator protein blaR1